VVNRFFDEAKLSVTFPEKSTFSTESAGSGPIRFCEDDYSSCSCDLRLIRRKSRECVTWIFGEAPVGNLVILTVPYIAFADVVKRYGEGLAGKVLIDITNPVGPDLKSFVTPDDNFGARESPALLQPVRTSSKPSTHTSPMSWLLARFRGSHWMCSLPQMTLLPGHSS
jgi:hypothetical protein